MTPKEVVLAFIGALCRRDFDAAMEFVAEDIVYDNKPLPTLRGASRFREFLSPWTEHNDEIDIVIHGITEAGDLVIVERTDRDRIAGKDWVETQAAGFYQVRDGRISEWRDYYDLNSFCLQNGQDYLDIIDRTRVLADSAP